MSELHPHKALIQRMERLKFKVSAMEIMLESGVTYSNYHNWQKNEPDSIVNWFGIMRELGLNPLDAKPGESTYLIAKKRYLTRAAVSALFLRNGYSDQIADIWAVKGDPRQIENFKKVNKIVTAYEKSLSKTPVLT